MRVLIVGAGEVGRSIAASLQDTHDVVVIDTDGDTVRELTYSLDVLALEGDGTDLAVLQEAGIEDAGMVIAATDGDETNVVICGTAKIAGDAFTIARVKRRGLLDTWREARGAFNVDFMISTDLLTAEAIFRISGLPSAHDVEAFAGGLVRMAEFEIGATSPVADRTISDADRFDSLTFAAIFREDEMIVARGDLVIRPGDRIVVIGSVDAVREFAEDVAEDGHGSTDEVVIVGGSEVGFLAAQVFEEHGYRPRVIEQDRDRARTIAEALPNTLVLHHDATDADFLVREHVDEADVVIAALDSDEKNLLVALLARQLGVQRTVTVAETPEYGDLFETVGVDVAINPREEAAEEIVRFTRAGRSEKVAMLEHDRAEVIEVEITEDSTLANREIVEATADLPDGVVIGAISRAGKLVTPRGSTVVRPGDHVIVFVDTEVLEAVGRAI